MRALAVSSLFLTAGSLLVIGGAILALFVFFPLFLLGLVGVIGRLPNRTVRQQDPSMNPREWRGSS
jgi:hypothetical protein